jgi:predicted metal-dependent phosphoesterase TrpH
MRLDLHIHSTASDGAWTPERVVDGASAGGLDVIALTDHDTIAGVERAVRAASGTGLRVVPGVELSSTLDGREIHVLGYFIDPSAPALLEHCARARELRRRRMERMISRLREQGINVPLEAVITAAGGNDPVLTRPHLARAMVAGGWVASVPEAFDRYLADRHPAYVPTELQSPLEAVEVVAESGGISVWAHPPLDLLDGLLAGLVGVGLGGLEVLRPRTSGSAETRLRAAARSAGLVISGGSDWHDSERHEPLGAFYVTEKDLRPLLEEGGFGEGLTVPR